MRLVLILYAIICLSACATPQEEHTVMPAMPGLEAEFRRAADAVKEKRYREAAEVYNNIRTGTINPALAADALFELALTYTFHDNPEKNYARAIRIFEEFLKLYPDNRRAPESQNLIYILKRTQDLAKENDLLKKNIEQLKELDIKHEERRIGK